MADLAPLTPNDETALAAALATPHDDDGHDDDASLPPSPSSAGGRGLRPRPSDAGVAARAKAATAAARGDGGPSGLKSRFRGVSFDRKKRKWRVQIKVASLGKSGVSVGYYETEEAAARAYDRAAIGLLGRDAPHCTTNFPMADYADAAVPDLVGKSRDDVKTALKSERAKAPRRRFCSRARTSRFMGVGASNRRNQWQARILVHGKVTHLGYYGAEEDAARVYDRVALALHGHDAQTNFPPEAYTGDDPAAYAGLGREALQRALGVKPMDKSSRYRGVSRKKGKWEAKVMVNRRWAYRELFDTEDGAAHAYDAAVWRLKPAEARSFVNFKSDGPPPGVIPGEGLTFDTGAIASSGTPPGMPAPKRRRAAGGPSADGTPSPLSARTLPPLAPYGGASTGAGRGRGAAAVRRRGSRALPMLIAHPPAGGGVAPQGGFGASAYGPPSPLARAIARTMSEPDLAAAAVAGGGYVYAAAPPPAAVAAAAAAAAAAASLAPHPHLSARPPSPGLRHSASLSALQYAEGVHPPGAPPPLTVRTVSGAAAATAAARTSPARLSAPAPLELGPHPPAHLATGLTPPAGMTPTSAAFASALLGGLGGTPRGGGTTMTAAAAAAHHHHLHAAAAAAAAAGHGMPDSPFRATVQIGGEDLGLFGASGLDDPLTPRALLASTPRAEPKHDAGM